MIFFFFFFGLYQSKIVSISDIESNPIIDYRNHIEFVFVDRYRIEPGYRLSKSYRFSFLFVGTYRTRLSTIEIDRFVFSLTGIVSNSIIDYRKSYRLSVSYRTRLSTILSAVRSFGVLLVRYTSICGFCSGGNAVYLVHSRQKDVLIKAERMHGAPNAFDLNRARQRLASSCL